MVMISLHTWLTTSFLPPRVPSMSSVMTVPAMVAAAAVVDSPVVAEVEAVAAPGNIADS
jgi:hypothetical protein